jgi:hypothetical protein
MTEMLCLGHVYLTEKKHLISLQGSECEHEALLQSLLI